LIVCLWPVETGAVVVTGAAMADTGAGVREVTTPEEDAVGAGVASGIFDPLSVQPATAIEAMSNAARLRTTNICDFFFLFMVFILIINRGEYTLFLHKL
jgi:hypothetical protein